MWNLTVTQVNLIMKQEQTHGHKRTDWWLPRRSGLGLADVNVYTYIHTYIHERHSVVSNSLQPHGLYHPWNSPGQNTGVGSCSLFPGIFPTQGSKPGLLHCRQILYQLTTREAIYI